MLNQCWQEKQAQLFGGSSPKPLPLFHITCCLPLTCNAGQSDSERLLWRLNRIFQGCTDVEKWSHQLGYKFLLSRNGQEVNIIRLAVMNRQAIYFRDNCLLRIRQRKCCLVFWWIRRSALRKNIKRQGMSRAAGSLRGGQWKVDTSPPQKALLSRLGQMTRSIVDRGWWMVDIEGGQLKMDG